MSWTRCTLVEARDRLAMRRIADEEDRAATNAKLDAAARRRDNETPAQREARERREHREEEAEARRWANSEYRQYQRSRRFYDPAFIEGSLVGNDIGLDSQIAATDKKRL